MKTIPELIEELAQFNQWIATLSSMPENLFFEPIKMGKWSPAEIISHITYWDLYILEDILPMMRQGANIQSVEFDVLNRQAATYALSGVSKEMLLESQLQARNNLISILKSKKETDFFATFTINGEDIDPYSGYPHTMFNYFWSFVWHDHHHKDQIITFLQTKNAEYQA